MTRPHAGQAIGAAVVAALVVVSGWTDVNRYFNQQMRDASVFSEFSGGATFAGREAAQLPAGTRVIIDERLLDEPTVHFLAPDQKALEGYKSNLLPLSSAVDTALLLGGDQGPDAAYLQRLYPGAAVKTFSPPDGGPVLLNEVRVSAADVRSIQGLNAEYRPANGGEGVAVRVASLDLDWGQPPVAAPFAADMTGALDVPRSGDYAFQIEGPPGAELLLDRESVVADGEPRQVSLAHGTHHLELKAAVEDLGQPLRLLWRPPAAGGFSPIPAEDLYSSAAVENGLLGTYFPNATWSGPASFQQIDPFVSVYFQVLPLPMPFSVEWNGQLAAPVAGTYRFSSTSIDSSQLFIDGLPVQNDGALSLTAGLHDLRLRYEAHSGHNHVELRWQPPGRESAVIPSNFLFPSKSLGAAQPLPRLPAASPAGAEPQAQPSRVLAAAWQADTGADSVPAGVALDRDGGVYLADAGRRTVAKLDASGQPVWTASPPSGAPGFGHLAAVAAAPGGGALAVDGDSGIISRFTGSGQYAGTFGSGLVVYHPRGLAVAASGEVYLADTGDSQVQRLSAAGQLLSRIGIRGTDRGELDQPTGVAVSAAGDVFVVDPPARKVVRFAPSGAFVTEWPFPSGPTADGPQLAISGDTLWVSDTEAGRVQAFSFDGEPRGSYLAPTGLVQPSGIAAADGYLVVAEPAARRVERLDIPASG
jgi:DNA-binding beta-propeller fold protein YncE